MKIKNINCPNCGANLNINENKKYIKCQYCNTNLAIEKDINDEINTIVLNNTKIISKIFPIIFITVFIIIIISFVTFFFISNNAFKHADIKSFNNAFTYSNGTQSGIFINNTLDNVITSNKKNKDHQIYVKYQYTKTNKEDKIIKIQDEIGIYNSYKVSIDYDNDGYVNLITIKKLN